VLPTTGNEILVDTPEDAAATGAALRTEQPGTELVGWVMGKVLPWEQHRERGYARKWAEYWRMWRGQWSEEDRNRTSERSRLIAPALAQAIEMTASDIEEALFGRETWFDIVDDLADEDKEDALRARDMLLEDMDCVNAKDQLNEAVLNSAIFGTGIVKINTFIAREEKPKRDSATKKLDAKGYERVYVSVESIRPDEFIPDPSGITIKDMLGCAHRVKKPMHSILEKIENGTYRDDALGLLTAPGRTDNPDIDPQDPQSMTMPTDSDEVDVVEYHGKVPLKLYNKLTEAKSELDQLLNMDLKITPDSGDGPLVECIVTIANGSVLLRAMVNPFVMKDRCIVAFQHEKVPGRFWGRGVSEKGYNPQKALDAGIRAYIDALGYVSAPMLGVDAGRVPKGFKMEVKPGKVWLTQGPPNEVLQPVQVGQLDTNLFNMSAEMERMVQMGTGQMDTASALGAQSQSGASSLSSNSMLMGAFVKRSKRSAQNVERNLVTPVVQKVMWRYMQFEPRRYPKDYEFRVKAGMGIVAREVEAMQMTQMMGMLPEQFGSVTVVLAKGIIEHTALSNKAEINAEIARALAPPSPEKQKQQQELEALQFEAVKAQAQGELLKNQKTLAEIRKIMAEAQKFQHQAGVEDDKVLQEQQRIKLMMEENATYQEQNRIALARLAQQDRALDLKEEEIDIKRTVANKKPAASS
jgi:hypothetical protein